MCYYPRKSVLHKSQLLHLGETTAQSPHFKFVNFEGGLVHRSVRTSLSKMSRRMRFANPAAAMGLVLTRPYTPGSRTRVGSPGRSWKLHSQARNPTPASAAPISPPRAQRPRKMQERRRISMLTFSRPPPPRRAGSVCDARVAGTRPGVRRLGERAGPTRAGAAPRREIDGRGHCMRVMLAPRP